MKEEIVKQNSRTNQHKIIDKSSPNMTEIGSMSPRPNAWTYEENKMYILFLRESKKQFEDGQKRRFSKIYLQMSLNIPNKTPQQCRTHHQKCLKKYNKVENILNKLLPDMKKKLEKILKCEPRLISEETGFTLWGANGQLTLNIKLDQMGEW